jgi:hypothetical protein
MTKLQSEKKNENISRQDRQDAKEEMKIRISASQSFEFADSYLGGLGDLGESNS